MAHFSCSKFEIKKSVQTCDIAKLIPTSRYVDYGNMIHFAVTATAAEGRFNVSRIYHQIWAEWPVCAW